MRGLSVRHHQGSVCVKGLEFHPQNSQVFFFFTPHSSVRISLFFNRPADMSEKYGFNRFLFYYLKKK